MQFITLLTDYGTQDFYAASLKMRVLSAIPSAQVVDISHQISNGDIGQAAYQLASVYKQFPDGTIHLVCVGEWMRPPQTRPGEYHADRYLALKVDNHFFLGLDNGLLSLVTEQKPEWVVAMERKEKVPFISHEVLVNAAVKIIEKKQPAQIGTSVQDMYQSLKRQVVANDRMITGHVIHVDALGNLITNITQEVLAQKAKNRSFRIRFGSEKFNTIHASPNEVNPGECFIFFNKQGLLEVGVQKGNAADLMGVSSNKLAGKGFDDVLTITFDD